MAFVEDDTKIVEQLLCGASLRTVMIPDPSIPTNYPMHIETYNLPHVIANGNFFWAFSGSNHLSYRIGTGTTGISSFAYTNIKSMFCSSSSVSMKACLMSLFRYRQHNWILKNNYKVAWDSDNKDNVINIKQAIEDGLSLKIALLDDENIWNMHPVDLPMFEIDNNVFILKTVYDKYPMFFRSVQKTNIIYKQKMEFFSKKPHDNYDGIIKYTDNFFSSFYYILSDGTYYNFFDISRATKQSYKRLIVFAEVLPEGGSDSL
ncbi:MAG: hypothetical protein EOM23_11810 [Candidatus Moranbacteria bacterium]|nr:hypothetical protein [Candidatus Moranbacteria bacterium]